MQGIVAGKRALTIGTSDIYLMFILTILHSNEVDFSLQSICMQERRTLNSLDLVRDHFSKKKVASPYLFTILFVWRGADAATCMIKSQHYLVGGATGSLSLWV
ncbi:hypothetical protein ACJX0J_017125 [Zea mays]